MIALLMLAMQLNCTPVPSGDGNFFIDPSCLGIEEVTRAGRDLGELIPGFHCPKAGPGDGSCVEWYGKAPDIGAIEFKGSPPMGVIGVSVR